MHVNIAGVAQAATKFIVIMGGDTILAVDQHAADERVRLEALQGALADAIMAKQTGSSAPERVLSNTPLASPAHVFLSWEQHIVARQNQVHDPPL